MEKMKRPKTLPAIVRKIVTGCGNMYVVVTFHEGNPFEVFGILGKSGACAKCMTESTTRCITTGLRYGVPVDEYIKALLGIQCPMPTWEDGVQHLSCSDAISKAVKAIMKEIDENADIKRFIADVKFDPRPGTSKAVPPAKEGSV
jgi:ribonucleoside-diphosphate reductase alpha chain